MFLLLFACSDSDGDECTTKQSGAYAFDEPGPWGETPAEVFGPLEAPLSGTLIWAGPILDGSLDPALAHTEVSLALTLDTESVTGGNDDSTCDGELEIDATITIATADGGLDETFPIVLKAGAGFSHVSAVVDLTGYDFAGSLELSPKWTEHETLLILSWKRDGEFLGAMQTGDPIGEPNPQAMHGPYAVISASS